MSLATINYSNYLANMRNTQYNSQKHIRADRRTLYGNPFTMKKETERDKVCDDYEKYFVERMKEDQIFRDAIHSLAEELNSGKKLLCWCYPKRCHCQTILDYLMQKGMLV